MKNSYKIIIVLGIVLCLALGALGIYSFTSKADDNMQNDTALQTAEPQAEDVVNPFKTIAEYDGELYTARNIAENADIADAKVLPIDAARFALHGDYVYYVTPGNEEYAPELRMCKIDGSEDKTITEFASPFGSPAIIGSSIYSAYYSNDAEGENSGIYKISIEASDIDDGSIPNYTKIASGEYYIYGYDSKYIYYKTNDGSKGTVLYRADLDGANQIEVLNYLARSDNIVVDGSYIFFSAYDNVSHSYKIYRSPKDGRGNVDAYTFECLSGIFDVIDGRLYYQADASIYSCELNGDDERKIISFDDGNAYAANFLKFGDILYFSEYSDDNNTSMMFRLDTTTVEKTRIDKN